MACLEKDLRQVAYTNLAIGLYVSMATDMPCFYAFYSPADEGFAVV